MLIKVTNKGTTTQLTKPELAKLRQMHELLVCLATNRPLTEEYREAADAVYKVLAMFVENGGDDAEKKP